MKAKFLFHQVICSIDSLGELKCNQNVFFRNCYEVQEIQNTELKTNKENFTRETTTLMIFDFLQSMRW